MTKTWGDIFREFKESTEINDEIVSDWRPCGPPHYDIQIPMAILIWLRDGSKIIYISKG